MATVAKTIRTECGHYEAQIEQRAEKIFAIKLFKWTKEWVEGYGKVAAFWEPHSPRAVFTDTLQAAEKLATEELRLYGTLLDEAADPEAP